MAIDKSKTFQQSLTEAVADLAEHGFDSQERVDKWLRRLRDAAGTWLGSPEEMEDQIRKSLRAAYLRAVDRGGGADEPSTSFAKLLSAGGWVILREHEAFTNDLDGPLLDLLNSGWVGEKAVKRCRRLIDRA